MALLQFKPPVKYSEQKEIFKEFLQHFKTFESTSESAATEAIEDLRIDEDDLSDDDELMDEIDGNARTRRGAARQRREPKVKYMQVLQDVADRTRNNVVIELNDLDTV